MLIYQKAVKDARNNHNPVPVFFRVTDSVITDPYTYFPKLSGENSCSFC